MVTGKLAIVTGGARGIGAGIARVLASQGARVAILDLDLAEAEKTAASLAVPGIAVACDAADAGVVHHDVEPAESLDDDLHGLGRLVLAGRIAHHRDAGNRQARGGGAIVNIASIAGLVGSPRLPAYAAAKAGVISLTKSLALEYAPHDIRVNVICPGFLWTRAWEGLARRIKLGTPEYASLDERAVFLEVVRRGVPLGREQTPEDIGQLVAFLASDAARNITGQWIAVDGGITLRQAN